jgi:hypothetical protein
LNQTNYNSINICGQWYLKKIHSVDEDGIFSGVVENSQNGKTKNVDIFIKNAPLLDPIKYMVGVHQHELHKVSNLPQFGEEDDVPVGKEAKEPSESLVIDKVNNPSNASYIDNLFNIINSQLIEKGFIHGIEWYGSFLGIKRNFEFNIYDDLDYLFHSKYFMKHVGSLFHVPKEILDEVQKPSLKIEERETDAAETTFDDFEDLPDLPDIQPTGATLPMTPLPNSVSLPEPEVDIELCLLEDHKNSAMMMGSPEVDMERDDDTITNSSYSSRTSYTNEYVDYPGKEEGGIDTDEEEEDEGEDCPDLVESYSAGKANSSAIGQRMGKEGEGEEDEEEAETEGSEYDEEYIGATIQEFPVQLICLQACEDTLDELMLNDELNEHELFSCMMQIIMILATYQKLYQFTHNDLHTNNVMFEETNKKFLHYEYNGKKYLVPTYGKIYKIIDFGRSIFTIQNQLFCGDCYQKNGDAYTQYNFGPCMNEAKPTVEPNYSFDLCRLACSMFDHLIQNIGDIQRVSSLSPFKQLVVRLCTDDKGLNVLYKRNREERYPCFKLYKMISRTVHNHTPDLLLETPDFSRYGYDGTTLPAGVSKKDCYHMNIDSY